MVTFSVVSSASAATDDDNNSADDDVRHYGKITFVDLAGSERLEQTESEGTMRTESGNINRSLFALGKVVSAISASNRAETATKCVRKLSWMRRAWLPACVCVVVGSRASGASDDGWLLVFVSAAGLRVPANRSDETSKPTRVSPRVPVCLWAGRSACSCGRVPGVVLAYVPCGWQCAPVPLACACMVYEQSWGVAVASRKTR